ncbi:MAG: ADP-heptose synthase, bifunctional sugar kinase/adenylyltransferase/ADP-heptose synthase, bifunctional sugar kinase/adenylyltransferase [Pelagibacterales bacterium]|nr:ADP-heptose synthase, bifunctional sugar kinase/adenylyltransferase/ADP-heptose synthase, bifunctional sugar kinase/adenylyltransferase [Pelagibacterales bacterium]|tara:strand:+ start:1687 stop:3222 length:1536 start_codon:yes stop_codon:yes gene_type:complete
MSINKILKIENLQKKIKLFKAKKCKIVLCHGVFDVLHLGHINHFKDAKKQGDILIVSVTADKFVNKGSNRPIFELNTRMSSLAALEDVDFVIQSNNASPVNLILQLKPNLYCKGKDYLDMKSDITGKIKIEEKAIKKVGGKIYFSNTEMMSSSKIINQAGFNLNEDQKKFLNKIKKTINADTDLKILNIIDSFKDLKVLVIGETIIDQYIFCEALGKSGKEPVLVLRDLYEKKYLGGAAALTNNLASFCKKVSLISYLGKEKSDEKFVSQNLDKRVRKFFLRKKNSTTIIKKRFVEEINKTKVLGVYTLNDGPLERNQETQLKKKIIEQIKKHDVVIVSDYGHGLISKNIAGNIIKNSKFLAVNTQVNASNIGYHVISKYKGANLLTMNETELRHELRDKNSSLSDLSKKISHDLKSRYTNVTCGKDGSYLYDRKNKKTTYCPAFATKVLDKVGTGDTMMTLLTLCLYKKIDYNLATFISAIAASENIVSFANEKNLNKINFIKSVQSYLK